MLICIYFIQFTIVVLTGDKLTEFYFLHLLYAIYYPVITHIRPGKFLPPGDVNPGPVLSRRGLLGPVPSRRGLLEDSPYRGDLGTPVDQFHLK
jgi:hypothetical protein